MKIARWIGAVVIGNALASAPAFAGLVVTLESAGIQSSQVAGVSTENFNSFGTGIYTSLSSSIGTYTSTGEAIVSPDAYGGSNQTNYFAIGAQSHTLSATLTLNAPASYFGMEWLAGDNQNVLDFYSGNTLIAEFSTASAFAATSHTGGPFGTGHYGNPNTNADAGEPFGYLNFFATGGTTFDKIVFSNGSTGSGFESDNHSVLAAAVTPPYSGTVITTIGSVPEPATILSAASALLAVPFLALRRRMRTKQASA